MKARRWIPVHCLIIISLFYSCQLSGSKASQKAKESEAIAYNNKAVDMFSRNSHHADSVHLALDYLNQAIATDSNYTQAYSSKVGLLLSLNQYDEAIQTSHMIIDKNPKFVEAYTMLGMIYDKTGKDSLANVYYNKALVLYENKSYDTANNRANEANRLLLTVMLDSTQKQNVLTQLSDSLKRYPNNKSLIQYKFLIKNFKRDKYIEQILGN